MTCPEDDPTAYARFSHPLTQRKPSYVSRVAICSTPNCPSAFPEQIAETPEYCEVLSPESPYDEDDERRSRYRAGHWAGYIL